MPEVNAMATAMIAAANKLSDIEDRYNEAEVEMPYYSVNVRPYKTRVEIKLSVSSMEDVRIGRKIIGRGKWEKVWDEYTFTCKRFFKDNVYVIFETNRQSVCEAIVTGKETVEVPDYDNVPKKTVERDIVQWKCVEA